MQSLPCLFVVLDSPTSACATFSFDGLESFSAEDSQGADAASETVCLDETLTGFDTSASSIDSARSKRFDYFATGHPYHLLR